MAGYVHEELSHDEVERQRAVYGPLAQSVRELADAVIRTEVDDEEIRAARAEIEAITERLRKRQMDGAFGVRFNAEGGSRAWGNAVVGLRNAIAPPLEIVRDPAGRASADFHLGAAYEGPPGLVHGGVAALILDQVLGEAAGAGGKPGMTGTLTLRYRRGTPLGDLRCEAQIDRVEGIKTFAKGSLSDAEGVTVEAEGVFILPKWAREAFEKRDAGAPDRFELSALSRACSATRWAPRSPASVSRASSSALRLELRAPGRLQHLPRGVVRARVGDQVGGAALAAAPARTGRRSAARWWSARSGRGRGTRRTSAARAVTRFLKPVM